ncbi:hypothetical protein HID58_077245 [Brassica napus]|uniref:Uncharacterized protein n=1 Tax=Brassica napus TaxID=3708 RepID=A0ABQ7YSI3_BRANA|nr:hypothetical protein HID58_077245 [Brassica napus]
MCENLVNVLDDRSSIEDDSEFKTVQTSSTRKIEVISFASSGPVETATQDNKTLRKLKQTLSNETEGTPLSMERRYGACTTRRRESRKSTGILCVTDPITKRHNMSNQIFFYRFGSLQRSPVELRQSGSEPPSKRIDGREKSITLRHVGNERVPKNFGSVPVKLLDLTPKEIRRPLNPKTEALRWRENPLDSSLEVKERSSFVEKAQRRRDAPLPAPSGNSNGLITV